MRVPLATISRVIRSYSATEPSHQTISFGVVSRAIDATHAMTRLSVPMGG